MYACLGSSVASARILRGRDPELSVVGNDKQPRGYKRGAGESEVVEEKTEQEFY